MKVLVLHGPNLNLLGQRDGDDPAHTLEALNLAIRARARQLSIEVRVLQTNHEGVLIDALHAERSWADGVVLNPGALAPTSYALRDAIAGVGTPTIEVHLSNLKKREAWRRKSVLADVCRRRILGKGFDSYLLALEDLAGVKAGPKSVGKRGVSSSGAKESALSAKKTLGRRRQDTAEQARSSRAEEPRPSRAEEPRPSRAESRDRVGTPPAARATAAGGKKTLGRTARAPEPTTRPSKTLGRAARAATAAIAPARELSRAGVRAKIAERLSGRSSPAEVAAWARARYLELQTGAAAEDRELLEDALQILLVSGTPGAVSEDALLGWMARLDG